MSALIVVANTHAPTLRRSEVQLTECGYLVAPAASFGAARDLLRSVKPDLLVANVQLAQFNGIHLALHYRANYATLPVIITHPTTDSVIEAEATRHGATFVADPANNPEFLAHVRSLIAQRASAYGIRLWRRKRASSVVEACLADARGRILDISYGGLRLAFAQEPTLPDLFDVTVPTAGLTVRAQRVWTRPSPAHDEFWCGAELATGSNGDQTLWRDFVDSVV